MATEDVGLTVVWSLPSGESVACEEQDRTKVEENAQQPTRPSTKRGSHQLFRITFEGFQGGTRCPIPLLLAATSLC